MEWANGLESSENGVQLWKLVVEVVDAALLGRVAVPKDQGYPGGSGQSKEDP